MEFVTLRFRAENGIVDVVTVAVAVGRIPKLKTVVDAVVNVGIDGTGNAKVKL